jgi:hypothetical protein
MTPCRAIKAWCLECSGGSRAEVRKCEATDCPLFPFRKGKNPNRKPPGDKPTDPPRT